MKRALSVNDVINKKRYPLDFTGEWREAFGTPENMVSGLCGATAAMVKRVCNAAVQGAV